MGRNKSELYWRAEIILKKNLKKIEGKLSFFYRKTLRKLKKNASFLEKNLKKIEGKMLVFYRKTLRKLKEKWEFSIVKP